MPDRRHPQPAKPEVPPRERLIVPLDVPTHAEALALVERLGDAVHFYKLGFELLLADGSFGELVGRLRDLRKRVFVDLKLFDVPETVRRAVRQLRELEVDYATVHGNQRMIEAACAEKGALRVLAVTVLTSIDQDDFADLGVEVDVEALVLSRARRCVRELGCDGVISSGRNAAALRDALGDGFLIACPGIRPLESPDDHKRPVTVEQALRAGADHIVVGRPIRDADDPRAAARAIQDAVASLGEASRPLVSDG